MKARTQVGQYSANMRTVRNPGSRQALTADWHRPAEIYASHGSTLLKLTVGVEADLLEDTLARGARGVVIEALGGGRVPPWWLPAIQKARAQGVTIVIASRCPSGRVWDSYGYLGAYHTLVDMDCLFAEGLNGQKACIKLMIVLAAVQTADEAARAWYNQTED